MDKRTFVGGGQVRKSSLNPCKIRKNDRRSNIIFKDVKEFNVIFLILISLFLVGISGYSSYAIFSDEIISNNEIKATVKIGNLDKSGANKPLLASNMIPVYYDDASSSWKKADSENKNKNYKWYDYDSKMWANAVTVTETNRTTYLNAKAGTEISMADINTMWVWIPRYKYTYFASNTPVEIPITFEKGVESTGTIKCVDAISANSGKSENCTDTTNGTLAVGKSTYTHPAFTFGDDELTGLWVAKFELAYATSSVAYSSSDDGVRFVSNEVNDLINDGDEPIIRKLAPDWFEPFINCDSEACDFSSRIIIIPGVNSLERQSLSSFFYIVRGMQQTNNKYGFSQDANINVHMARNMEWGVTAYFTHSKYGMCSNGICSEMGVNNISYPMTGCGAAPGSSATSTCNQYNTVDGMKASTTGNIYGIYDMNGSAAEFVMANMHDTSNAFAPSDAGVWTSTNKPLEKYYDKYSYGTESGVYTRGKLGDAIIEMQPGSTSWYGNYANFIRSSSYAWLYRDSYSLGAAGIFSFSQSSGIQNDSFMDRYVSTRAVITVK